MGRTFLWVGERVVGMIFGTTLVRVGGVFCTYIQYIRKAVYWRVDYIL